MSIDHDPRNVEVNPKDQGCLIFLFSTVIVVIATREALSSLHLIVYCFPGAATVVGMIIVSVEVLSEKLSRHS